MVLDDRLVLRYPGNDRVLGGARVLDAEPPVLRRRGDGARWAAALADADAGGDVGAEVARRGAVRSPTCAGWGCSDGDAQPPAGVRVLDGWWLHGATYAAWQQRLTSPP